MRVQKLKFRLNFFLSFLLPNLNFFIFFLLTNLNFFLSSIVSIWKIYWKRKSVELLQDMLSFNVCTRLDKNLNI